MTTRHARPRPCPTALRRLPKLAWTLVMASQGGCASSAPPVRPGERIGVPAQYETTARAERRDSGEVVGVLVSHRADTVSLRERPHESVRVFVLPPRTQLAARMARLSDDPCD